MRTTQLWRAVWIGLTILASPVNAGWIEAQGSAEVKQGNQQLARQQATEQAVRQALLFAGASVNSVQRVTNGLLTDDMLEVRASGDINSMEIIAEDYSGDIVTVSIRADIFANTDVCRPGDYQKTLVTTWAPIKHKDHATYGGIFDIGKALPDYLRRQFAAEARHSMVKHIEPIALTDDLQNAEQAVLLAQKADSQFVLFISIDDLSVETPRHNSLAFWKDATPSRYVNMNTQLYNGATGELLMEKRLASSDLWEFDWQEQLDSFSPRLWQSRWGQMLQHQLANLAIQVDEQLACIPAYGRVTQVSGDAINIDLGKQQGVRVGDRLQLFQLQQFYDASGELNSRYVLHPIEVEVKQVFTNSALVMSADDALLANIQANDFVMRR